MAFAVCRAARQPAAKQCRSITRLYPPAVRLCRASTSSSHDDQSTSPETDKYYDDLVKAPSKAPPTRSSTPTQPTNTLPKTEEEERIAKARVVFGSTLAGPMERRREIDKASTRIAGILVPPRPDEPDNCCMSGCVNCVWDRYRDELEDWASANAEAREAIQAQRSKEQSARRPQNRGPEADMPSHVASSIDDDGGGSEALWTGNEDGSLLKAGGDLFEGVPVGIREFMRQEKKLKEKKAAEDKNKKAWEEHMKRLNSL